MVTTDNNVYNYQMYQRLSEKVLMILPGVTEFFHQFGLAQEQRASWQSQAVAMPLFENMHASPLCLSAFLIRFSSNVFML